MGLIAVLHIALISLVILLPIALVAMLVWYFIRSRGAK